MTIILATGWNFSQSKNEVDLSDLTLANVEALAQIESKDGVETVDCAEGTITDSAGNVWIMTIKQCSGSGDNDCSC